MEEVWKDIKGYEGLYQISNNGKIISIKRKLTKKTFINRNGYEYIDLYIKKKRKRFSIHYLVASTFIDGEQENLEINHKDGNKLNNCYLNLEWVTRSENQQHQRKMYNTYRSCFYCKNCGKEITKNSCLCLSCFHDLQRSKIIHPTKAELEKDIKTMSIVKIGKKYNLSDNGIRKRCIRFGITI